MPPQKSPQAKIQRPQEVTPRSTAFAEPRKSAGSARNAELAICEREVVKPFARSMLAEKNASTLDRTSDAFDVYRILNEHRKECEISGDYDAARLTRERLNCMRESQYHKHKSSMEQRHDNAIEYMREEQKNEFLDVTNKWKEGEMPSHEAGRLRMIEDLRERQQVELTQFKSQLSSQVVKPKYSPEILNLKRRMQVVGVQGQYDAAQTIQKKINKLVAEQEEKHKVMITERYDRLCAQFIAKQKKEFDALTLKRDSERNSKLSAQQQELALLARRQKKELHTLMATQVHEKAKSKLPILLTPR